LKQTALFVFFGLGLLFIALSVPLILGKVPPNQFYGYRTKKVLSNPDIWYPVNRYGGWALLWAGVVTVAASVVLFFIPELNFESYNNICLIIMSTVLIISTLLSYLYTRRF